MSPKLQTPGGVVGFLPRSPGQADRVPGGVRADRASSRGGHQGLGAGNGIPVITLHGRAAQGRGDGPLPGLCRCGGAVPGGGGRLRAGVPAGVDGPQAGHRSGRVPAVLLRPKSSAGCRVFYFYIFDERLGPGFIKFCTYFPYPVKAWVNGHEWAKRQALAAGIGFTALSNGFASCDDPAALQAICDRFGPGTVRAGLQRWMAPLPLPLTSDDQAPGTGISFDAADRILPHPGPGCSRVHARAFFETLLRDNHRHRPPGQRRAAVPPRPSAGQRPRARRGGFKTKSSTGLYLVTLNVFYRNSRMKQYHNCDMRSHAASGCVERRVGLCRRRSPGQRRKTCPRRDVRAGLLGWRVRSSRKSPRVPDPSGGHRRGEGRAGVNASELLLMPR